MTLSLPLIFLAVTLPAMPPAPIGETFPGEPKGPEPIIFEFQDYSGEQSNAKARVTPASALEWCGNWRPGTKEKLQSCAREVMESEGGRVYEAKANCQTGDLWEGGKHYIFDGPDEKSEFFSGYVSVKDAETGKPVGVASLEGRRLGTVWLDLCPLGMPYNTLPPGQTYKPGPDDIVMGEGMGHNGSVVFHHENVHVIVYSMPKPEIAGTIKPDTVLFRGWHVPGEWFSGVAYTFKKGCDPAPYLVSGHYQRSLKLTLSGKAPVRDGCKVVGYSASSPNAKLVFDLAAH